MRNLNREFTIKENIILIVLAVIVIAIGYYYLVHKPVRSAIEAAEAEIEELTVENEIIEGRIAQLERMSAETADPSALRLGYMASYNNSEAELRLLNDILKDTLEYTVSFSGVSRSGDLVRRSFTLHFRAEDYQSMKAVLEQLTDGEYRCLIGDLRCSEKGSDQYPDAVTADASATFYETMAGGTADLALPDDTNN